jgi:hypothetical protein
MDCRMRGGQLVLESNILALHGHTVNVVVILVIGVLVFIVD